MTNMKNTLISAGVAVLVVVLAFMFLAPRPNEVTQIFGAVSTNSPTEPFYFQGGSTGKTVGFISTTTVAAFIQNPTNATTTFTARFLTTATTTTTVLAIATSTNVGRYATTTAVLSTTVTANANGMGSYVGANNQNLIGPGEWVQIGYGSGTTLPTVAQLQTGTFSVSFLNIK